MNGAMRLEVREKDKKEKVVGEGAWNEAAYECGGTTVGPFSLTFAISGAISGKKESRAFQLVLAAPTGSNSLNMAILKDKKNSASGTVEIEGSGGYGSSLTFTVTCKKGCR